jgi:hypothetical protein
MHRRGVFPTFHQSYSTEDQRHGGHELGHGMKNQVNDRLLPNMQ